MTKELVTIQVGTHSNFISTHFWNLLNANLSISSSTNLSPHTLFRELNHKSSKDSEYFPRVQIIDTNGSFGALSHTDGRLHVASADQPDDSPKEDSESWPGSQQVYRQEPILPHRISWNHLQADRVHDNSLNLKGTPCFSPPAFRSDVLYWSDYLTTQLHPRSLYSLRGVHHDVTDLRHFSVGTSIATSQCLDDIYDDLRFFIEDCDNFGGLNLIANSDDAFAGIAASYLDVLSEELGDSIPKLFFSAFHPDRLCSRVASTHFGRPFTSDVELLFSRNEALLLNECLDRDIQYVPLSTQASLSLPVSRTNDWSRYQLTAPLGFALETALSPLTYNVSLSSCIRAVRSSASSLMSGLFANVTYSPNSVAMDKSFLSTLGTSNLSYTWQPIGLGAVSVNNRADWSVFERANTFLTARGCGTSLPVSLNLKDPAVIPDAFPNVFKMALLTKPLQTGLEAIHSNVEYRDRIPAIAGFVNDDLNASTALKALSDCLRGGSVIKSGIEGMNLNEIQENLKSRAEDIAAYMGS